MKIPYEDKKAIEVNELIFETIYHAAMETSMEIAKEEGPYETF
jgi:ribonucleoside-diphosphate reductase subunit M1